MTKYYVESGSQLRYVVLASDELDAICKAIALASLAAEASAHRSPESDSEPPLRMAELIIVSERGFVWDRPGRQLYGDEFILPTRLVLGQPEESPAE